MVCVVASKDRESFKEMSFGIMNKNAAVLNAHMVLREVYVQDIEK